MVHKRCMYARYMKIKSTVLHVSNIYEPMHATYFVHICKTYVVHVSSYMYQKCYLFHTQQSSRRRLLVSRLCGPKKPGLQVFAVVSTYHG